MADDPLRIAMISYYLPSESKIGVGYQVHALATALAGRGHDVTSQPVRARRRRPLRPSARPPSRSLRTFRFASQMRRRDLSSYDVLHAHGEDYWMWRRRVPTRAHAPRVVLRGGAAHPRGQ